MSHIEKLCQPALASHIETCHEQCNYTPLIISRGAFEKLPHESGISSVIEHEVSKMVDRKIEKFDSNSQSELKKIKKSLSVVFDKTESKTLQTGSLKSTTLLAFEEEVENQRKSIFNNFRKEIIENSEGRLDLNAPDKAIQLRTIPVKEELTKLIKEEHGTFKLKPYHTFELDGLGMFFKESVCYRPEGKTYPPCGEEVTILPGEIISESNVLKTTVTNEDSTEINTSEEITTKDSVDVTESFSTSYDRTVKKETDIKLAKTSSFKAGIPFKLFTLNLDGKFSSSFNFNKIITEVNKSSNSLTQKRFNEVVQSMSVNSTVNSSRTLTSTNEVKFSRTWTNNTQKPQTYIRRKSYCKTSVLHKRHNVQLAWSGCIDNPAKNLCTPDNIEEKNAKHVQAIRDKWNLKTAPSEFGPEPKSKSLTTTIHTRDRNLGGIWYRVSISHTIPNGWYYVGGSADAHVDASVRVQGDRVEGQPPHGATGTVTFTSRVDTVATRKPIYTKFSFKIMSLDAKKWQDRVQQWRDEKAQEEIDTFFAEEDEKLNKFLASDQAKEAIARRIYADFFGVNEIKDCCRFIARIERIFDFDAMCYSLLPSWNDMGEGCQRSFPVNLYTAKCLHFYLPIREGAEIDALSHLVAINAITWNSQIAAQVMQYVQAIQNMRNTLYNRVFDPAGWDVKFDQPKGYDMTPYDTAKSAWSSNHESDLNYELLGAFTINVPCGFRIDLRPALCKKRKHPSNYSPSA